jgi:hypothetical protein
MEMQLRPIMVKTLLVLRVGLPVQEVMDVEAVLPVEVDSMVMGEMVLGEPEECRLLTVEMEETLHLTLNVLEDLEEVVVPTETPAVAAVVEAIPVEQEKHKLP